MRVDLLRIATGTAKEIRIVTIFRDRIKIIQINPLMKHQNRMQEIDPKNKTIHPRLIRINRIKMKTKGKAKARGSKVKDKVWKVLE
ncbi:uncharacterized protein Dana_GF27241 [Drosophila ananassae]|uniref:Uncharacterized protein n=1 Tax=Drosophila ananassae TaxID=7217 RepID=A0A0P8YL59_DROAN|nr:uncharacterized protein Dana_GF27241 [Drosophila ananassae]